MGSDHAPIDQDVNGKVLACHTSNHVIIPLHEHVLSARINLETIVNATSDSSKIAPGRKGHSVTVTFRASHIADDYLQ